MVSLAVAQPIQLHIQFLKRDKTYDVNISMTGYYICIFFGLVK